MLWALDAAPFAELQSQCRQSTARLCDDFRRMRNLRKFAAVHAFVPTYFSQGRHLYNRRKFKLNRTVTLAEWRRLIRDLPRVATNRGQLLTSDSTHVYMYHC